MSLKKYLGLSKYVYICQVKFKLLTIFLIVAKALLAQTTGIKGIVSNGKEPLSFAVVAIPALNKSEVTNESGVFSFSNIPKGKHEIKVVLVGYRSLTKTIWVEPNGSNEFNFILEPLDQSLSEVTVSGTLSPVTKSNSPVPVEIYSHKFFTKSISNNLFDALQMINGVQPTLNCNVCNTGDIHINGLDGPYTMVLIDGMPMVTALGTVYGLMGIPNSIIERVEVVKGPASTLYGSEAVAGIINVITKDASSAPKLYADVYTTSYLENNIDLALSKKFKKSGFLFSANAFLFNQRWDINNDNFTDVTLQNRVSVFNKWYFKLKNKEQITLAARVFYEDRFGGEMQWKPEFRGGDSVYGESIYTQRAELLATVPIKLFNVPFKINNSYIYHHQNSVYGNTYFIATQQTAFTQLTQTTKIGLRHELLSGMALRYQMYDDNTPATENSDLLNSPNHTFLPGVFIQHQYAITEMQTLLTGLRYDYFNNHGNIFSPRINYKVNLNRYNTIRLSAGNGFRVVNLFTEDHAALTGARQVVIRSALKPEESWNININYNRFIDFKWGFLSIDASAFYTHFTNKIVADFDTDPNKIIYDNLNEYAISRGFTFNSDVKFTFPLTINAGITLMDVYTVVKDSLGSTSNIPQLHAPKFTGTWQISYTLNKFDITLDYTGQAYGPMRLPVLPNDYRPEYSPWFGLHHLQLTKKFNNGVAIYFGIKNLFNFLPKDPIMRPFDPFDKTANDLTTNPQGYTFDPSYNYAPLFQRRFLLGLRLNIN